MSEKPPIMMVRRGSFLTPLAPLDSDALAAYASGKPLKVKIAQVRSLPQHRLYWAMLSLVVENLDQPVTPEDLHEWVKGKMGYVTPIRQRNGQVVRVTRSIAFDKMEQGEFQVFFDRAKSLLVEHVIPGLRSDHLEREARLMLGEPA